MTRSPRAGAFGTAVHCPSCGSKSVVALGEIPASDEFAGRRLERPLAGGSLFQCMDCELRFRWPRPTKAELDALYREGRTDHWQRPAVERPDWTLVARALRALPRGARVLDVGCFDGGLLGYLGPSYERFGIEIHEEAAARAESRGVRILGRDLEDVPAEASFDAVVAVDVIEHVQDPLRFLAALARASRPGGLVVISTGDVEAPSRRWLGSRHAYCAIPEHVSFIGPAWCRRAAARTGLELTSIERFAHAPGSLQARLAELGKNALYGLAPGAARWARRHGAGGKDVGAHPELADHPPAWASSRDHFLARLVRLPH